MREQWREKNVFESSNTDKRILYFIIFLWKFFFSLKSDLCSFSSTVFFHAILHVKSLTQTINLVLLMTSLCLLSTHEPWVVHLLSSWSFCIEGFWIIKNTFLCTRDFFLKLFSLESFLGVWSKYPPMGKNPSSLWALFSTVETPSSFFPSLPSPFLLYSTFSTCVHIHWAWTTCETLL